MDDEIIGELEELQVKPARWQLTLWLMGWLVVATIRGTFLVWNHAPDKYDFLMTGPRRYDLLLIGLDLVLAPGVAFLWMYWAWGEIAFWKRTLICGISLWLGVWLASGILLGPIQEPSTHQHSIMGSHEFHHTVVALLQPIVLLGSLPFWGLRFVRGSSLDYGKLSKSAAVKELWTTRDLLSGTTAIALGLNGLLQFLHFDPAANPEFKPCLDSFRTYVVLLPCLGIMMPAQAAYWFAPRFNSIARRWRSAFWMNMALGISMSLLLGGCLFITEVIAALASENRPFIAAELIVITVEIVLVMAVAALAWILITLPLVGGLCVGMSTMRNNGYIGVRREKNHA